MDCLGVLLSFCLHYRSGSRSVRQIHAVVVLRCAEAGQRFSVNGYTCQLSIAAGSFLELDSIGRCARVVLGFDGDDRRRVVEVSGNDSDLVSAQFASGERLGRSFRVCQRSCSAHRFDSRDRGGVLAKRIILNLRAVGVKAFPFLVVHIQFLDLGRIDQADVIDVE